MIKFGPNGIILLRGAGTTTGGSSSGGSSSSGGGTSGESTWSDKAFYNQINLLTPKVFLSPSAGICRGETFTGQHNYNMTADAYSWQSWESMERYDSIEDHTFEQNACFKNNGSPLYPVSGGYNYNVLCNKSSSAEDYLEKAGYFKETHFKYNGNVPLRYQQAQQTYCPWQETEDTNFKVNGVPLKKIKPGTNPIFRDLLFATSETGQDEVYLIVPNEDSIAFYLVDKGSLQFTYRATDYTLNNTDITLSSCVKTFYPSDFEEGVIPKCLIFLMQGGGSTGISVGTGGKFTPFVAKIDLGVDAFLLMMRPIYSGPKLYRVTLEPRPDSNSFNGSVALKSSSIIVSTAINAPEYFSTSNTKYFYLHMDRVISAGNLTSFYGDGNDYGYNIPPSIIVYTTTEKVSINSANSCNMGSVHNNGDMDHDNDYSASSSGASPIWPGWTAR